jgi:YVTN family beta-propeller protein
MHPQGLAVDSKSNRIYIANVHGNSVTVIDGARNAVVGVRNAGSHPYAVTVDQSSGHVYAANYGAPWVTLLPDAPQSIPPSPVK